MSRDRSEELRPMLKAVAARMLPAVTPIGFPAATDLDFSAIAPLAPGTLNNIGDPTVPGLEHRNVKDLEREVVAILADLFRAPRDDRWGCVTSGGTEGNLYGLFLARTQLPNAVVYFAETAHYSVAKAAHLLNLPAYAVPATDHGELDYGQLSRAVGANPHRPAIVVATVGTTMTEAVDNVAAIRLTLDQAGVPDSYIHVDAALSGMPLALSGGHVSCDLGGHVDSLTISGHKFLATPEPCGVLLTRRRHRDRVAQAVSYIGGVDATIAGSRSGHTVLQLWWALRNYDMTAHRKRAEDARDVARHTVRRLTAEGWTAWRHPHAFTVVIKSPSPALIQRWSLATSDGWSHIVCVPGVSTEVIDRFVDDLTGRSPLLDTAPPAPRRRWWQRLAPDPGQAAQTAARHAG
ncbi:MAG TPA: histidine decarboxylase [Pseudonocardia sp.]|nr:histidine decarboxylase [Pseudonocardia sp.]